MATILSRKVWGARSARSRRLISQPTPRLWLHHTAGAEDLGGNSIWADDVRGIQSFHMDRKGWSDIAYSFLADQSGQLWEGRGPLVAGGHTAGDNTKSHGVAAIGNFETLEPSDALLQGLAALAAHGHEADWWLCRGYTGPHRDAPGAATACCGKNLISRIPEINAEAEAILRGQGSPVPPPVPEVVERESSVRELYRLFAGREGDESGVKYWASRTDLSLDDIGWVLLRAEGMDRIWKGLKP